MERITKEIKIIGVIKRKAILGSFFKTVERDDADIVKIINKRIKLEKDKISKEQELRIQAEALESQVRNAENMENVNEKNVQQQIVDNNNISTPN